jgi:hypothetical protein
MRYLLFGGEFYYAAGGANDFLAYGNSVDDLMAMNFETDWAHVFDAQTREIVAGSNTQAYGADDLTQQVTEQ